MGPFTVAIAAWLEAMHGLSNMDNIDFPSLRLIWTHQLLSICHVTSRSKC